jgi:hypothetical protein
LFGIVSAIIGSIATGLVNAHVEREQQRLQAVMESTRVDIGHFPIEFEQIKVFFDQVRNLSVASSDAISRLAEIHKKYPGCANNLSDRCRPLMVETIRIMRDELQSGAATSQDIDLLLYPSYLSAQQAFQRMQSN